MPRPLSPVPALRKHKSTRQAVTTVRLSDGRTKDLYLGRHGTAAASTEYARIIATVAANGGIYPDASADAGITVNELMAAYLRTCKKAAPKGGYVGGADAALAVRAARRLFGTIPVVEFGPRNLKALRDAMVTDGRLSKSNPDDPTGEYSGLSRKTVNARVGAIKRIIKWGVSEELVPVEVYQRLTTVEGLRSGQTIAPDREPVRPAVMADVEKMLPYLTPTVRALVIVQLHSGARAGELVRMRVGDIDRTDPNAWTFRPSSHKGTWRGKGRTIYFGAKCREALAPLLLKAGGPDCYVFNPRTANAERLAERSENRLTPRYPSHMRRNEAKRVGAKRRRPPADHYTTCTYRRAIERACERAGVPEFTPHRLRHLAATRVRAELGVDAARALLGHSLASITEIYSHEVDKGLALKAVAAFG